jgi:hypothetical protein
MLLLDVLRYRIAVPRDVPPSSEWDVQSSARTTVLSPRRPVPPEALLCLLVFEGVAGSSVAGTPQCDVLLHHVAVPCDVTSSSELGRAAPRTGSSSLVLPSSASFVAPRRSRSIQAGVLISVRRPPCLYLQQHYYVYCHVFLDVSYIRTCGLLRDLNDPLSVRVQAFGCVSLSEHFRVLSPRKPNLNHRDDGWGPADDVEKLSTGAVD